MNTNDGQTKIIDSIEKLYSWIIKQHYFGWDIYDGLNSPITKKITSNYLKILILQINKYSPFNFRPIIGIEKGIDLKGMTVFAQAYALLYNITGELNYLNEMNNIIQFIIEKSLKKEQMYDCWASHYYPYISIQGGALSKNIPDIIGTSQAIIALIESYKITKNPVEKEIASNGIEYLINKLYYDDSELSFFKYIGSREKPNHITLNASAQAIEAISAFLSLKNDNYLRSICTEIVLTLQNTQRDDGSWAYSIYHDGSIKRIQLDFHQGYIIDGLLAYLPYSNNKNSLRDCILKASNFYQNALFRHNGSSYYRYPMPYPIDIHNQAQGVISFSKLGTLDSKYIEFAYRIVFWTIENMQDKSGYFYYQRWPFISNKIPHMRWGQAWMMLALSKIKEIEGK